MLIKFDEFFFLKFDFNFKFIGFLDFLLIKKGFGESIESLFWVGEFGFFVWFFLVGVVEDFVVLRNERIIDFSDLIGVIFCIFLDGDLVVWGVLFYIVWIVMLLVKDGDVVILVRFEVLRFSKGL